VLLAATLAAGCLAMEGEGAPKKKIVSPCCTCCLSTLVFIMFFAVLLMHISLANLIPSIKDLPSNLAHGFGEVLRFDYLEEDSINVNVQSSAAIALCGNNAELICDLDPTAMSLAVDSSPTNIHDTTSQHSSIKASFENSLGTIDRFARDPYFGTEALEDTATQLAEITAELDKITQPMHCLEMVPIYCGIYAASNEMLTGVADVHAELDKFQESEQITTFEDYADWMDFFHVLPWIMVIAFSFYFCFWFFGNGVCCCCKGGKCAATLLLIPHSLLCLLFFVFFLIVAVIGLAWTMYVYPDVKVPDLKGEPTVEVICVHLQDNWPKFWDAVFAEMEEGLQFFWFAAMVFTGWSIALVIYEVCVCCHRPFKKAAEAGVKVTPMEFG
jgi:hypothetical protein